ncbi:hypothetical protein [Neolewinella sp.]|uniref:hypothetical protein n=1 Tax=Neolewinella sp. TaxID=2993543 RepID=UPI003B51FF2C
MPDKPPTTWSANEAFWNEAWQDMDHRLSQGRRRRRRSPLPWLLLALLLAGLIGAGTQVQWSSREAAAIAIATTENAPESLPAVPANSLAAAPRSIPESTDGFTNTSRQDVGIVAGVATSSLAPARPAQPDVLPPVFPYEENTVITLPTLPIALLDVPLTLPLPVVVAEIISAERPVRVVAALGASTYTTSRRPGGFAEVDYLLGRGRWRLPLALRYDYGAREVWADPLTQQELSELLDRTGPLTGGAVADASEVLYTHELSLRSGIIRTLGREGRLSVGAGVGLRYALAGEGPVVSGVPGMGALDRTALNSTLAHSSFNPLANGVSPYLDPRIHRWGVDGWLQLRYRFGRSWGVLLGTSHAFSPTYREERLDVDRTRIEVGLTKGF